ncbi:MAG: hypothetical protein QOF89_791 [Acidobacteriota bacterium]|jgi:hypothetical protein|nr:hypothetical protein [Acidobacteriota bacterium]
MEKLREIRHGESNKSLSVVQGYLKKYGYLNPVHSPEPILGERTSSALRSFQKFFHLSVTGMVDRATIRAMKAPRCGLKDWEGDQPLPSCRWPKDIRVLLYSFGRTSSELSSQDAFGAVQNAIDSWNDILSALKTNLQFRGRSTEAELHVKIEWFDPDTDVGLKGTPVAHADLPPDCGVVTGKNLPKPVHFDDEEYWTLDQVADEFHVESVAMHELGHILGLPHSAESGSIMSPTLPPDFIHPGPTPLDIINLGNLYL